MYSAAVYAFLVLAALLPCSTTGGTTIFPPAASGGPPLIRSHVRQTTARCASSNEATRTWIEPDAAIEGRIPSPDGQSHATIRTFEVQLPPGDINVAGTTWNPCGFIKIAGPDGTTNRVRWVRESRGVEFDLNPITAFSGSLVPANLQWDSTEPYLYFEFGGGPSASGVWRVDATNSVPVYVGPTRESFRLQPQSDGLDHVVCSQVRDGKWLWATYTPDDISRPQHVFSTNVVSSSSSVTSYTQEQGLRTTHISYRDENYRVPGGEIWKLTWPEPHRGRNFPSYDVRVLGSCFTSKDEGTQIFAFSRDPNKEGLVDILAGEASAEIWIPSGIEFYLHNESIKVRVDVYRERDAADQPRYEVVSDNCSADSPALVILHAGRPIYRYTWRHFKTAEGQLRGMNLVYTSLANRSGKPQPKPYDDIIGNGLPDLVINEYVTGGTAGLYQNMLTIVSLDGTNVVETPAVPCYGELFYFKDFDGNGTMEIVNSDWEQGFSKYDGHGVPMHKGVWKCDSKAGRYRETGDKLPDPPDTWPAYRNKMPAATQPAAE